MLENAWRVVGCDNVHGEGRPPNQVDLINALKFHQGQQVCPHLVIAHPTDNDYFQISGPIQSGIICYQIWHVQQNSPSKLSRQYYPEAFFDALPDGYTLHFHSGRVQLPL